MKMKTHPRMKLFPDTLQRETNKRNEKCENEFKNKKNPDWLVLITFWCLHKTTDCERKTSSDCISTEIIASNACTHEHTHAHIVDGRTCYNCIIKNRLTLCDNSEWKISQFYCFRCLRLDFSISLHFSNNFLNHRMPASQRTQKEKQISFNFTSFRNRKCD